MGVAGAVDLQKQRPSDDECCPSIHFGNSSSHSRLVTDNCQKSPKSQSLDCGVFLYRYRFAVPSTFSSAPGGKHEVTMAKLPRPKEVCDLEKAIFYNYIEKGLFCEKVSSY